MRCSFSLGSTLTWPGQFSLLLLQLHHLENVAPKVATAGEERDGGATLGLSCLGLDPGSRRADRGANLTARELGNAGEDRVFDEYTLSATQVSVYLHATSACA